MSALNVLNDDLGSLYRKTGYVHIPGLLSSEEVAKYRKLMENASHIREKDFNPELAKQGKGGWALANGINDREEFWPIITHPKLISSLKQIVGPNLRYASHSDLHVHHGTVGWHRDSSERNLMFGADWDEEKDPFNTVRVCIYLQSYQESGFKLGVMPRTHRSNVFAHVEHLVHKGFMKITKKNMLLPVITAKTEWLKIEAGDCVIFDVRLLHTGSRIRGPKYSMYMAYGPDNKHTRNHKNYYLKSRPDLNYTDLHPKLAEQLKTQGLLLT